MNSYMTKNQLALSILAKHETEYRWVKSRWWRLVGGNWTQDQAREHLIRAIMDIARRIPEDSDQNRRLRTWAGMSYGYGWLLSRCKEQLAADGLPGRAQAPSYQLRWQLQDLGEFQDEIKPISEV